MSTCAGESSGRPEEPQGFPLFPPQEWADRLNASRGPGLPVLTSLDPLAMLMWHTLTRPEASQLTLITGVLGNVTGSADGAAPAG